MRVVKLIFILVFGLSLISFFGWKFYDSYYFLQTKESITIEFRYMEYACGGCDPNWNVQQVLNAPQLNKQYYDKDMEVHYNGLDLEDVLKDINWQCIICYGFKIKGKVKRSLNGHYRFIAEKYTYTINKSCCNN